MSCGAMRGADELKNAGVAAERSHAETLFDSRALELIRF